MEQVARLVSRTPPEGLTDWAPVRDGLEHWGLVYEAVWIPDYGLEQMLDEWAWPRKRKVVEVRCSCCGESRLMPWAKTDPAHGGYGFLQEDERTGETALIGSGDESVCPICGEPVRVRKAAEIGSGYFVADETQAMSAAVVGMDRWGGYPARVYAGGSESPGAAWTRPSREKHPVPLEAGGGGPLRERSLRGGR